MIQIDAIVPQNDVKVISDALKKIKVGGITVFKARGRGKSIGPKLHAAKGTEVFTPEFTDRYIIQVIITEKDENNVIDLIRNNTKMGKIFVSPISRAVDIASGEEGDKAI